MTDVTEVTDDLALGAVTSVAPNGANGGLPQGLPMPRDPELLFDLSRRRRVTTITPDRFPFPVPDGWFIVAEARELAVGEIVARHFFGRDLVVFRDEAGVPHVLDAHCPHLGAHLAVGGRVEGGCVRCPYHAWRFDGASGRCVEIPYGDMKAIPSKAHARAYPTIERNHMVWAWYHAKGAAPFYEVPDVPEFSAPDWSPVVVRTFDVQVAAQEMAENNVDFAHFQYVHGTESIPDDGLVIDGTYKRSEGMGGAFVREGFGLGLGVLRVRDYVTFLSSTTPYDAGSVQVRWIFTSPVAKGEGAAERAADSFCAGVSQDIPIWENKVYRDPPVITKTEKLILEQRRWARQFYSDWDT